MADELPGKLWRVVEQFETTDVTPRGRFRNVIEVVIETVSGASKTLRIPEEMYSAEVVRQQADAWARALEETAAL